MTELLEQALEAVRRQPPEVQDQVAEAMLMLVREPSASAALAQLQEAWAAGLASGPGRFRNIEEIKREARRRFEVSGQPGL